MLSTLVLQTKLVTRDFKIVLEPHSYNHQVTLRWYQGSLKILYMHPQSLGMTLETFQFPEAVQVFLNPAPIRVASTPNKTKTNRHWLYHLQTLHTH